MKSLFAKLIFCLQILTFSPLIFLIIVIWPIFKIRIGCIKSKLLGSLALEPEIFLCEKKAGIYKKNEIFLWYHQQIVANKYLLKKRKKQLLFLPGFILYPIVTFFFNFKFTHKHIYANVKYSSKKKKLVIVAEKLRTDQKLLKKIKPSIIFSKEEIENGNKYLEKYKINKDDKIALFGARTALYRNENTVSKRNSNIQLQVKSMKLVTEHGYKAIRIGKEKVNKLNTNSDKIFDYTFSNNTSEFLDIFIASKAKFMVCGPTGLNELATMMRVPRVLVDYASFNHMHLISEAYTPIILFKKLFSMKTNKLLSYEEIIKKKLFDLETTDQIPGEYKLIDNTEDEILEATKEMIELIEHKTLNINVEFSKQIRFWKIYENFYSQKLNMIISPNFYKKNFNLFN